MSTRNVHGEAPHLCEHAWQRRADLDATLVLRFVCSKCGILGFRRFAHNENVRPYPDGRTRMPEIQSMSEETPMSARRRFFLNPSAVEEWRERKRWKQMLEGES